MRNVLSPGDETAAASRVRLGFCGAGWIGVKRMKTLVPQSFVDIAAIADPDRNRAEEAAELAKCGTVCEDISELLDLNIDGVVIATPSAFHAQQCIMALRKGISVFCQKPLARNAREARMVIDVAKAQDRLLGIDMSYRYLEGCRKVKRLIDAGEIGEIFGIDCVFHNAYGPDKSWFYDRALSGGGCVIDLGIHLVDLVLWFLDFPEVKKVSANMFAEGMQLVDKKKTVEDYADIHLNLSTGASVHLACSWKVSAGTDAVIGVVLYGTKGGLSVQNVAGSFYDFKAERFYGTRREVLCEPPDQWGGRALTQWALQLAKSNRFDDSAGQAAAVADVLDCMYACV